MRRLLWLAAASCAAFCGPKLYLKTRTLETSETAQSVRSKQDVRTADAPRRVHMLIQYDHGPTREDLDLLAARNIVVNGYLHENGLVVACDDPGQLEGLGLRWSAPFEAADKISPLLLEGEDAGSLAVVVEFHSDVDARDGRRWMLEAGLELPDNPDLGPHHALGIGPFGRIAALASRDEVAYMFPAGTALQRGEPLRACASALTAAGGTGQYVARVGDGWDGPGRGAAALGYYFQALTPQLPAESARAEIVRAMNQWSNAVKVAFAAVDGAPGERTVNILFARGAHDDPYPFDGPGNALAHTFYPAPPNPETLAGDMHFDEDEAWRIGSGTDLFSVALHELGHSLGLGHSDRPGAVMYPYYSRWTALTAEDILAVQELYAPRESIVTTNTPPPPQPEPPAPPPPFALSVQPPPSIVLSEAIVLMGSTSSGTPPVLLTWRTDRGHSGLVGATPSWSAEVPLESGTNRITLAAADAARNSASKTVIVQRGQSAAPVALWITYPGQAAAFSVAQPATALRGTAAHASGISRVSWTNSRGGAGDATGTTAWDSGVIALLSGSNLITVRANAADGSSTSRAVEVIFGAASRDATAPTLSIISPGLGVVTTSAASIALRGTAKDNVGVTEVAWFSSTGPSGKADGTTSWSTPAIPLVRGFNSLIVRAFDAAGNMSWRAVSVTRQ